MTKLRHQSELANDKLTELKEASEDSWKSIVAGAEKVRDTFIKIFMS
jgi:hypothetical protein